MFNLLKIEQATLKIYPLGVQKMYKMKQPSQQSNIKITNLKRRINSKRDNCKAIYLLFCYCIYLFRNNSLSLTLNDFKEINFLIFAFQEFQIVSI